jgi:hypothetical protein
MSGMNIQETRENIKRFLVSGDNTLVLLIVGVGMGLFFLGRASVSTETPLTCVRESEITATAVSAQLPMPTSPGMTSEAPIDALTPSEGGYVASKNGTKYHLPWCGSAKQIKEENKIWFSTKAEAEAAGYTPASNCKGI